MGVVTVKSGAITNRDSTPQVPTNANILGGILREFVGTVVVTTGNSSASKYILGQIPSNARMSSLLLFSDDMGTATAADFGLYQTTENGGAVVDADFFVAAQSLNGGAINGTDIAHGNTAGLFAEDLEKMIWQAIGLSADPKICYDVVATLTADSDAGGDMSVVGRYVV